MLADTLPLAPASVSELHPKVQPVLLQYPEGPPSLASNLLAPLLQLADTADNDAIRAGVIAVCWDAGVLFTFAQLLVVPTFWRLVSKMSPRIPGDCDDPLQFPTVTPQTLARLWLWLAGTPATGREEEVFDMLPQSHTKRCCAPKKSILITIDTFGNISIITDSV